MRPAAICILVTSLVTTIASCSKNDVGSSAPGQSDAERIKGTWCLVSNEVAGTTHEVPRNLRSNPSLKLVITDETHKRGDNPMETYRIDPSKNPKTIDFTVTEGPQKGMTYLGIYFLEGSTLTICRATSTQGSRPAELRAKDANTIVYAYERQ